MVLYDLQELPTGQTEMVQQQQSTASSVVCTWYH
jgi:hypothetical protein